MERRLGLAPIQQVINYSSPRQFTFVMKCYIFRRKILRNNQQMQQMDEQKGHKYRKEERVTPG